MCTGTYDLTRSYLETLSSTDLIDISHDYGIDIPENFSRSFIITEILDTLEEQDIDFLDVKETKLTPNTMELPFSFNENKITATLKNPAWCYVSWDFKSDTIEKIANDNSFDALIIRFEYFSSKKSSETQETIDVIIKTDDREQFILLTQGFPQFQVSLLAIYSDKKEELIASSSRIFKPKFPFNINLETLQKEYSNIQTLSGLHNVLKTHYTQHRQSFVGNYTHYDSK